MIRRLLLRRPEEKILSPPEVQQAYSSNAAMGSGQPQMQPTPPPQLPVNSHYEFLAGPQLTWFRLLSRDLGSHPTARKCSKEGQDPLPRHPVAEWNDASALPLRCREVLKEASGITIPGKVFILKVMVAYVIVLVPLNWLVCRFLLRRREWSWALVPILSLAFAIGVERAAAYDLGFDSGCDEIALMETYGGYPRAHVSRFSALFSTGRVQYAV